MQHAALVGGGEARAELAGDLDGLVLRDPSDPAEQRGQILAVHVLHRQERPAVRLAEIVETADVLVRNLSGCAELGVKLGESIGIGCDVLGQELQGHRLVERQVVGAEHLAHAAAPEQRDESIPPGEH